MRLLVDNNLSPRLASLLAPAGWDVVHVGQLGLRDADDRTVLAAAYAQQDVLLSADTDVGGLLAASHDVGPSVVLVRRLSGHRAEEIAGVLLANLPVVTDDLASGSVVVLGEDSMGIRSLPI